MAPVAVAPPPLRFSFQPLAGHKVRRGCGAQSPARKKRRIGCGAQSPARKKTRIDKGTLRPVSKKARPELQGSLLHARGLAAQTQPLARPRAAARRGFCLRNDVQQHRKVYEAWALHNGVLPYMIAQSGPIPPLAGLSNQQAGALLLDDGVWEKACPDMFVQHSIRIAHVCGTAPCLSVAVLPIKIPRARP